MTWKREKHWYAEVDARCDALVKRAKRPGHDNTVTVRYIEPTKLERPGGQK